MINTTMRDYDFFLYGAKDDYGQDTLTEEVKGTVRMSINLTSQSVADNILYKDCSYIGLTHNKSIDDTYVIKYGNEKLKVQYVNPKGRYNQVYLVVM